MKKRTFKLGHHIWFYLTYNSDGTLKCVEKHDYRVGGLISPTKEQILEDLFITSAVNRASGDDYKELVKIKATEFLSNQMLEMMV
jgi:hypothetical protein